MRFCAPTNFDDRLIPRIANGSVDEIYGKLPRDCIGGMRPAQNLPAVELRGLAAHVRQAHRHGLGFNYVLNATCLGNREFTRQGQREISGFLGRIEGAGADSVTVAVPFLLEIIKKRFPRLRVRVSAMAGVNSVPKARYWRDLGADAITLPSQINRDFVRLAAIRRCVDCPLMVVANVGCLHQCPFAEYHRTTASHATRSAGEPGGFLIDYCAIRCIYELIRRPWQLIAARWIRPEDVGRYEAVGIDSVKLADRGADTATLAGIVDAYSRGSYDGNLLDLIPRISGRGFRTTKLSLFRTFFKPSAVNVFELRRMLRRVIRPRIHVDNKKLDGFLEGFLTKDCSALSCEECGYCRKVSERAVSMDPKQREESLAGYAALLDSLASGKMFQGHLEALLREAWPRG